MLSLDLLLTNLIEKYPNDWREVIVDQSYILADTLAKNGEERTGKAVLFAIDQLINHKNSAYYNALNQMERMPPTIEEFVNDSFFLGNLVDLWPSLVEDLKIMHPDHLLGQQPKTEVILGGATGTGKSFLAQISVLYNIIFLKCFPNPQLLFGLNRFTPIVIMMQSVQERVTKRVLYDPVREFFEAMPYRQKYIEYDRHKESTLKVKGGIELVPALASVQTSLGQAVIMSVIDEANFMPVVENSKQVPGPRGKGGLYDAAHEVYRKLSTRRKRSFKSRGVNPGGVYLLSSVNYEDDFIARRIAQLDPEVDKHVHVVMKKQYEAQPAENYSGERFKYLIGTSEFPGRILKDDEKPGKHYREDAEVELVPMEYLSDFRYDPDSAQREIIGRASAAIGRFITQNHLVYEAVERWKDLGLKDWVDKYNVDLLEDGMPQIIKENLPSDKHLPRYIHIDLSSVKDRCGIAVTKVSGYEAIMQDDDTVENVPHYVVECAISIQPSPSKELDIDEVRRWVMQLKTIHGINIASISYDQYQSKSSIQLLRKSGVKSNCISVDASDEAYNDYKQAIYDGRIELPPNEILASETIHLEKNEKTGKIDHPPKGSKDIADAVAGSIAGALASRDVRTNIAVTDMEGNRILETRKRPNPRRKKGSGFRL